MTRVKVCGLRRVEDALTAAGAGADLLGFIFAPSRRQIEPAAAASIIARVKERFSTRVVGVFVNADLREMQRVARVCRLDYVQLSGDEPDGVVKALDVATIQVFHVGENTTAEELGEGLESSSAELVLLDSAHGGTYGGSGRTFDWSLVPEVRRPLLIAGGLRPENVEAAVTTVHPWGVDVSSGVERDGQKDPERIREFIARVRSISPSGA